MLLLGFGFGFGRPVITFSIARVAVSVTAPMHVGFQHRPQIGRTRAIVEPRTLAIESGIVSNKTQ